MHLLMQCNLTRRGRKIKRMKNVNNFFPFNYPLSSHMCLILHFNSGKRDGSV